MVILLGASGYIGQAFEEELRIRGWEYRALSRSQVDYTSFRALSNALRSIRPTFLINAAGFTGKPNVDACEIHRAETLLGNAVFPRIVADACESVQLPWAHVSSGCIYSGAKFLAGGSLVVEPDLTRPDLRERVDRNPELVIGFTELDPPNFSFRSPPCSFYSGSKALGEEALVQEDSCYIWRLRIPFDERDHARNYLSKVQRYSKVYDNANSISHRRDFVSASLDLWARRAPFGTYNITNPGFVTTRQVVECLRRKLALNRSFEFWASDEEFYRVAAKTPRSNCVLDVKKLLATGVKIRPVEQALEDALDQWRPDLSSR